MPGSRHRRPASRRNARLCYGATNRHCLFRAVHITLRAVVTFSERQAIDLMGYSVVYRSCIKGGLPSFAVHDFLKHIQEHTGSMTETIARKVPQNPKFDSRATRPTAPRGGASWAPCPGSRVARAGCGRPATACWRGWPSRASAPSTARKHPGGRRRPACRACSRRWTRPPLGRCWPGRLSTRPRSRSLPRSHYAVPRCGQASVRSISPPRAGRLPQIFDTPADRSRTGITLHSVCFCLIRKAPGSTSPGLRFR